MNDANSNPRNTEQDQRPRKAWLKPELADLRVRETRGGKPKHNPENAKWAPPSVG